MPDPRLASPLREIWETDIAEQTYPGDPEGRTYAQLIAEGQCKAAIKGKTDAAREIREALEGKTPQAFGDDTANMSLGRKRCAKTT